MDKFDKFENQILLENEKLIWSGVPVKEYLYNKRKKRRNITIIAWILFALIFFLAYPFRPMFLPMFIFFTIPTFIVGYIFSYFVTNNIEKRLLNTRYVITNKRVLSITNYKTCTIQMSQISSIKHINRIMKDEGIDTIVFGYEHNSFGGSIKNITFNHIKDGETVYKYITNLMNN